MEANQIKFILLKQIGNAYIDRTVTDDEMKRSLTDIIRYKTSRLEMRHYMKNLNKKGLLGYILGIVLLCLIDQLTKIAAVSALKGKSPFVL